MVEDKSIAERMARIRQFSEVSQENLGSLETSEVYEAGMLAKSVLIDTCANNHPLVESFTTALVGPNYNLMRAACRTLVSLYRQGALRNPALRVAQELEGEILAVADAQVKVAEASADATARQTRLSVCWDLVVRAS